ncbi:MAG: glutamate synthase subunit alpha, partial [Flavobacteriaceae bacterium]|nr:glutamate synthase subunit alpha [Flavobacteriaceae bacterium]
MFPKEQGLYSPRFEHDNCGAGFICSLKGKKTNDIIHKALDILCKLEHRGAVSSDGKTGDGAGILIEIPHDFFISKCDFKIPKINEYAVGMTFLPSKKDEREICIKSFEKEILNQGLKVLGWRNVPVDKKHMGKIASKTEPCFKQVFISKGGKQISEEEFNIKLYIARKTSENLIRNSQLSQKDFYYFSSLSPRTIIYKGLLTPQDIGKYFIDLNDSNLVTKLALVHQRFSTNTFPTWDLAQPFRYMCHNGEINTFRGNLSRMKTREEIFNSELFGKSIKKISPVIVPNKSDSASMDMVVEFLLLTGRSLPEVMMMLVPEAWEKHFFMNENKKSFYKYNSCIMEPWDGPASIPFTDGKFLGALLDRNGLRPSRYSVTKDGYVVMSSETGVLDIKPDNILKHGRLEPGKMFLVNMEEGRIIEDEEIKMEVVKKYPYKKWLKNNLLLLKNIKYTGNITPTEKEPFETRLRLFGYTQE